MNFEIETKLWREKVKSQCALSQSSPHAVFVHFWTSETQELLEWLRLELSRELDILVLRQRRYDTQIIADAAVPTHSLAGYNKMFLRRKKLVSSSVT